MPLNYAQLVDRCNALIEETHCDSAMDDYISAFLSQTQRAIDIVMSAKYLELRREPPPETAPEEMMITDEMLLQIDEHFTTMMQEEAIAGSFSTMLHEEERESPLFVGICENKSDEACRECVRAFPLETLNSNSLLYALAKAILDGEVITTAMLRIMNENGLAPGEVDRPASIKTFIREFRRLLLGNLSIGNATLHGAALMNDSMLPS